MADLDNSQKAQAHSLRSTRQILGDIPESRLRQLIAEGRIRAIRLGQRGLLIPHQALLDFLAVHTDSSDTK